MHRLLIFSVLLFSCFLVAAQRSGGSQQGAALPALQNPREPEDPRLQHEREKSLNVKRQEDLKRDTDKLLKLATELKDQVDRTNENILALDVIKKADEIEKLAKSVKDKMKAQALEPMPALQQLPPPH